MQAETVLSSEELEALWYQLIADPDSAYRFELTQHGEMVVSAKPTNASDCRFAVASQLQSQLGGLAVTYAAVLTQTAASESPTSSGCPASAGARP